MKPVDSYLIVTSDDIHKTHKEDNYISYQGENLLFRGGGFSVEVVKPFLEKVYPLVGKIVVEKNSGDYYILSNKYKPDVVEPFNVYADFSRDGEMDIVSLAKHVVD